MRVDTVQVNKGLNNLLKISRRLRFSGGYMLNRSDIKSYTTTVTYARGLEVYRGGKVMLFDVENDDPFDVISASVKGSGSNIYHIGFVYDNENEMLEDIDCNCPAFESYSGLCKHCVAVMLEYTDYLGAQESHKSDKLKKEEEMLKLLGLKGGKNQKTAPKVKPPTTTPSIKQLLTNRQMKKTLPLLQDQTYGKVRVDAYLDIDSLSGIKLEFKVGITHMYVLKDVFSFYQSIENNVNHSYGQKLKFVHTLDAFDIESRPLVKFIYNWAMKNGNQYMKQVYYGYSYGYSPVKIKSIPLGSSELGDFLDVMGERTFIANVNGTGEYKWNVTEDELPRIMDIKNLNGGIEVKINHVEGFKSKEENIYFHEQKIYRVPHIKMEGVLDFLDCMVGVRNRTVFIQKEDVPAFCRELLPSLEQFFKCNKDKFKEEEFGILPVSYEIYVDAPQRDFITCKVIATYGDKKYNIYDSNKDVHLRDLVNEIEVGKVVSSYCNAFDDKEQLMVVAEEEDKIYEFLIYGIPKLGEIGEVYISDALKRMTITKAPKVSVGVSITGDLLELSMTSDDMSKEQLLEILTKYNKKKKFYRLADGNFVSMEGEGIEALLELKQGLHLSDSQLKQDTIQLPKYRTLYLDAELKSRESLSVDKNKGFKALVRNMKTVEDSDFDIPSSLSHILREYQKRGFLWIKTLKFNGFGGILADDMGLGKSLQVISFLLSEYLEAGDNENKKALIVCPSSLVFNWNNEILKFAPTLPAKMVIGTTTERQEILKNAENKDILITSYDLLKRDVSYYEDMQFYCEIIDEAQYIKNYNTMAAKAVKMINAGFKLALTGTPIENRLSELWSIFDYLMPGFLYGYQRFREELEIPIVTNQEEQVVKRLQRMISPFILRRLKKDVLTDLPDKLEENMFAKLEGEQQKLYDAQVKRLQIMLDSTSEEEFKSAKIQILSELTKLRQVCCDPSLLYEGYKEGSAKVEMCMDLIQNAISGGHKILLFSQFTSLLDILQKRLEAEKISFFTLTGATSKEKRAKMVESFNKDETSVFCISLKAGGTGLNLTAADIVIHFDPWWNIAVQNQATDRAHRIGQKNVVSVYKLIVQGTIEENIMKIQEKKKELADQVLSGEGMNAGSFSKEDLMELLR